MKETYLRFFLSLFFSIFLPLLFSVSVPPSLHPSLPQAQHRAPSRCSVNICSVPRSVRDVLSWLLLLPLCLSVPHIPSGPSILASQCLCISLPTLPHATPTPQPSRSTCSSQNHTLPSPVQDTLRVQEGVEAKEKANLLEKLPHPSPTLKP